MRHCNSSFLWLSRCVIIVAVLSKPELLFGQSVGPIVKNQVGYAQLSELLNGKTARVHIKTGALNLWANKDTPLVWTVESVELPTKLNSYGAHVAVPRTPPKDGRWDFELLFQEIPEKGFPSVPLEATFAKKSLPVKLVLAVGGIENAEVTRTDFEDIKRLREILSEKETQAKLEARIVRYALFDQTVVVTLSPPKGNDAVAAFFATHRDENAGLIKAVLAKEDALMPTVEAKTFAAKTNELFRLMNTKCLINDKLELYEIGWRDFRLALTSKDPLTSKVLSNLKAYNENLFAATEGKGCTVRVFSTKGNGAEIKYAKLDGDFIEMGLSVATQELERAQYRFEAYRDGTRTGAVSADCTTKTQEVTIPEK